MSSAAQVDAGLPAALTLVRPIAGAGQYADVQMCLCSIKLEPFSPSVDALRSALRTRAAAAVQLCRDQLSVGGRCAAEQLRCKAEPADDVQPAGSQPARSHRGDVQLAGSATPAGSCRDPRRQLSIQQPAHSDPLQLRAPQRAGLAEQLGVREPCEPHQAARRSSAPPRQPSSSTPAAAAAAAAADSSDRDLGVDVSMEAADLPAQASLGGQAPSQPCCEFPACTALPACCCTDLSIVYSSRCLQTVRLACVAVQEHQPLCKRGAGVLMVPVCRSSRAWSSASWRAAAAARAAQAMQRGSLLCAGAGAQAARCSRSGQAGPVGRAAAG